MPLAAIMSATAPSSDRPDLPRAQIVFAAQTLIEYQARQAIKAGATHLLIMVDAVTPVLSRLVDRLAGESVQVHLIRDMPGLVRQLPRDGDVLLFADGMVIDQKYLADLAATPGNAVLVVGDDAATAHLERVDSLHRWAGVARVSSFTLFNTLDLIGDWDLVLTLLRAVVQADARRVLVAPTDVVEGRVALVDRQATADLIGGALSVPGGVGDDVAGAERYLLQPIGRLIATHLLRMQVPARQMEWSATGVAALGLLTVAIGWSAIALILFLVALTLQMVSRQLAGLGHHAAADALPALVPAAVVSLGIAWLGTQHNVGSDGLHLGILTLVTVAALKRKGTQTLPAWALMTPGSAVLILLVGLLLGSFAYAMSAAALLAILSLASLLLLGRQTGDGNKLP